MRQRRPDASSSSRTIRRWQMSPSARCRSSATLRLPAIELLGGGERFDLVFSDIVMPEMSGIELADRLVRLHGEVAILLTTGYSSLPAGAGDHGHELLIKPYGLETLKLAIERCLAGRRGTPGASWFPFASPERGRDAP